jgi:hypothetical protein
MTTLFDFVTVACFLAMAGAFFFLTEREPRTMLHLLIAGTAFAVANQLGNAEYVVAGWVVLVAGAGYAAYILRRDKA